MRKISGLALEAIKFVVGIAGVGMMIIPTLCYAFAEAAAFIAEFFDVATAVIG